jgi:hypothetical protein
MNTGELVHQLRLELWNVTYTRYLTQELFSWQWWAIVAFLAILYAVWWRFVDKSRLLEIMLFGSFVSVLGAVIDIWGVTTAHWQYNIRLFPLLPAPFPFDYTAAPIVLMLAYQHCRSWKSYLVWSAAGAALFSFGMLRAFEAAGIITLFNWSLFYSLGIFGSVAIVTRAAILLTLAVMSAARAEARYSSRFSPLAWPATKPLPDEDEQEK